MVTRTPKFYTSFMSELFLDPIDDCPDYDMFGEAMANRPVIDFIAGLHPVERRMLKEWPFHYSWRIMDEVSGTDTQKFEQWKNRPEVIKKAVEGIAFFYFKEQFIGNYFPLCMDDDVANELIDEGLAKGPSFFVSGEEESTVWVMAKICQETDGYTNEDEIGEIYGSSSDLRIRLRQLTGTHIYFNDQLYADYLHALGE